MAQLLGLQHVEVLAAHPVQRQVVAKASTPALHPAREGGVHVHAQRRTPSVAAQLTTAARRRKTKKKPVRAICTPHWIRQLRTRAASPLGRWLL